jgi:hypothetical protein
MDEVHRAQVDAWAERHDTQVDHVDPHELPGAASADAIVCDWDGWTPSDRRRILAGLQQKNGATIIVKGYRVAPAEAELLECLGADIQPTWDPASFDALAGEEKIESGDALFHDGARQEDNGEILFQALDNKPVVQDITPCLTKSS